MSAVATTTLVGCMDDERARPPAIQSVTRSDIAPTRRVPAESELQPWGRFLGSASAAQKALLDDVDPAPIEFVETTDFEAGDRLLFVQAYGRQTCYRLEVVDSPRITRTGRPVAGVTVQRTEPPEVACGDAITPVSILLRVTFDVDRPLPDQFGVRVDRPEPPTTELSLAVRV